MRILVLGGTRFVGRAVAAHLLGAGHSVTVSSRRPCGAPPGAVVLPGNRDKVLAEMDGGGAFDLVLDFTAYDSSATMQALSRIRDAAYVLISTTWLAKLKPSVAVDEPVPAESLAPASLPAVTRQYLHGKAAAERLVLDARSNGRVAAVLRLPIVGGAGDHTGRLDFYRRRVRDGGKVLLVNGGANRANLVWCEDVGAAIAGALAAGCLWSWPILDGLTGSGHTVAEVLEGIAVAEAQPLRTLAMPAEWLCAGLPEYLVQEPLWMEQSLAPGQANLFRIAGVAPHPLRAWLASVCSIQPPRPESDGLRERELGFLNAVSVI